MRGDQTNEGMKVCCDNPDCGKFAVRVFERSDFGMKPHPCSHGSYVQRKIDAYNWMLRPQG